MNLQEFYRLPEEWIPLFINEKYETLPLHAFYDTRSIKIIMYHFEEWFKPDGMLYSTSFEKLLEKLKKEGYYPFYDEKILYKKWSSQGVFFLTKEMLSHPLSNKILTHLYTKKNVIWVTPANEMEIHPESISIDTPFVFKKINEKLYQQSLIPISW